MTASSPDRSTPAPAWKPLDARQRRVLGVLIEKAKTTPGAYPMSVNAIVVGSNQKNNRDPLTAFDDVDVENALNELNRLGVVSEIDWVGRVPKYKHNAYEWLGVSKVELAVLAELLLRGAQAIGELRSRAARMEPIADLGALKPIVDALVERKLMIELTPPGRGQIVSHGLYHAREMTELKESVSGLARRMAASEYDVPGEQPSESSPTFTPAPASGTTAASVAALSAEIDELRTEVANLRERLQALEGRVEAKG